MEGIGRLGERGTEVGLYEMFLCYKAEFVSDSVINHQPM